MFNLAKVLLSSKAIIKETLKYICVYFQCISICAEIYVCVYIHVNILDTYIGLFFWRMLLHYSCREKKNFKFLLIKNNFN